MLELNSSTRAGRFLAAGAMWLLLSTVIAPYAGVFTDRTFDKKLRSGGGSDGAGSLPFVGPPGTPDGMVEWLAQSTDGLVIDNLGNPIVSTLIVVTHPTLGVIAQAFTDDLGYFAVDLPEYASLEISVPAEFVAGISVKAGEQIIIVVP